MRAASWTRSRSGPATTMPASAESIEPGQGGNGAAGDASPAPALAGADASLLALVDRLTAVLERSELGELEVASGGTTIVLRAPSAVERPAAIAVAAPPDASLAAPGQEPAATAGAAAVARGPAKPSVNAPLTGIFYAAPSPGATPYVAVGDHVAVGQIIGLIEAMKLFNEIKSDLAGRVARVCVDTRRAREGQAAADRGGAGMTATEHPAVRLTGWGRYAPSQVLTNADLERMVDTSDEWIVVAHGHPRAAGRRGPRDHGVDGRGRRAARDPHRRPRARRHRRDHPRDPHAGLLDAVDRGAGQGGHRQHARLRLRRHGRLLRLRLRLRHRVGLHHRRAGEARARHRRRAPDPVPRLHRPQHLHPVRRRGRGGRAVGVGRADGARSASSSPPSRRART